MVLRKHRTWVLLLSELINGPHPHSHPWYKSGSLIWRAIALPWEPQTRNFKWQAIHPSGDLVSHCLSRSHPIHIFGNCRIRSVLTWCALYGARPSCSNQICRCSVGCSSCNLWSTFYRNVFNGNLHEIMKYLIRSPAHVSHYHRINEVQLYICTIPAHTLPFGWCYIQLVRCHHKFAEEHCPISVTVIICIPCGS